MTSTTAAPFYKDFLFKKLKPKAESKTNNQLNFKLFLFITSVFKSFGKFIGNK
jgi:hypothetical protein